jgi:c-di-GMP-binding flagellar brake protein YcgR
VRRTGPEMVFMNSTDRQLLDTAPAHPERRRYPRRTVQVQLELHLEGSDVPLRMETTDLSRGGCYVQLMMTLPIATYLQATLWLDNCPVRVRARVVTRHPQFGNGIIFLEFEGNGEKALAEYLDAITL